MVGQCKLCGFEKQICESHTVPKFIYRWIKDTSVTSHIRKMSNPNMRVQDGHKKYLLCKECEDKFSKYEKSFAQKHFYPSVEGLKTPVSYGEELFYFANSVLWRFMLTELHRYEGTPCYEALISCQSQLKDFLKSDQYPTDFDQMFVIFTNEVVAGPSDMKGLNYFFTRMVSCQIIYADSGDYCFFYLQIPYFIFFSNIYGLKKADCTNRVNPIRGQFDNTAIASIPGPVSQFMKEHLELNNSFEVSDKQQEIIYDAFKRSMVTDGLNKLGLSAIVRDHLRDSELD